MAEEKSLEEIYASQGREMPKFLIECGCGFSTSRFSLDELLVHLVDEHGFSRDEVEKALDDSYKEVYGPSL